MCQCEVSLMQASQIVIITSILCYCNEPIMQPNCDEPSNCETVPATLNFLSHFLILFVISSLPTYTLTGNSGCPACSSKGYAFCKLVKELKHHPDFDYVWAAGCRFISQMTFVVQP